MQQDLTPYEGDVMYQQAMAWADEIAGEFFDPDTDVMTWFDVYFSIAGEA